MAYSNKANVLRALANTIKSAQLADQVTIIAKAKVPIVKFVTKHGRFKVDISINQSNGVAAGRIINGFLTNLQSTALRSIIMITKTFLSQRSMNEVFTGGLGSYSIVCLAVSFLQMHPKIRRGEIDAERNLGVLVMEFFELYGCYFNYEEVGISVRDGGTYFNKKERGWLDYSRRHLLSIEDPADPGEFTLYNIRMFCTYFGGLIENDISRGTFAIAKVRTTFAGAHGILTAAAYLRAGLISARRNGRSINLRGYFSPDDMSILSSVMGVTQEVRPFLLVWRLVRCGLNRVGPT
jgi:non-canonical poly(A) RNA polymerase PAPD5/7